MKQFRIKLDIVIDRKHGDEELYLRFGALDTCKKIIDIATRGKAKVTTKMFEQTVGKQVARRNKRK